MAKRSPGTEGRERLELTWPGKEGARRAVDEPSACVLEPIPGASVEWDGTENLVIEGDALDVLKLLGPTHSKRVKVVYIDPPYNTGNDGVYKDDFRGHTRWLEMIYPRLALAKPLLREDGVIFVSIDESELGRLLVVMDEIFGDENRQGVICWRRRYNQPNDKTKMIAKVAEFIVAYASDSGALRLGGVGKVDLTGAFANPDDDLRGPWATKPWKVGSDQSGTRYAITTPAGVRFDETWMGEEATYRALLADGRIVFPNRGRGSPRKKYFQAERAREGQSATNWWPSDPFGHNQGANAQLTELFGTKNVFSNPKPVELVRALLQIGNVRDDDIVLDFFAGSGSTGHAVMLRNAEDGGRRRFILAQIREGVPEGAPARALGLDTIPDITRERLRRAGTRIAPSIGACAGFRALRVVPRSR